MSFFADIAAATAKAVPEDFADVLQRLRHRPWSVGSVSQVEAYRACPSLWYLDTVCGMKAQSDAASLGTIVHEQARAYVTLGLDGWKETTDEQIMRAREIVLAGAQYLPPPGSVDETDTEWQVSLHSDAWPVPVVVAADLFDGDTVVDYKTSGDINKAAKSYSLSTDVQGSLCIASRAGRWLQSTPPVVLGPSFARRTYPAMAAPTLAELQPTVFKHVYLRTKQPIKASVAEAVQTPETIAGNLAALGPTLHQMAVDARALTPRAVGHNTSACFRHGPCAHIKLCSFLGRDVYGHQEKTPVSDNPFLDDFSPETPAPASVDPDAYKSACRHAAASVDKHARLEAAVGLVAHAVGAPKTTGQSLLMLAACAKFAPETGSSNGPFALEIANKALNAIGAPLPHSESVLGALYGATVAAQLSVVKLSPVVEETDPLLAQLNAAEQAKARSAGMQSPEDPSKAADEDTTAAPKKREKRAPAPEEMIPHDERLPKDVRGMPRKHIDAPIASRFRALLATACQAAGFDFPTIPASTKKAELVEDIARAVELLTGTLPWITSAPAPIPSAAPDFVEVARPASKPAPVAAPAAFEEPTAEAHRIAPGIITRRPAVEYADGTFDRWLYIDCAPRGVDAVELSDFLAPLQRMIEAEKKVPHYLAIPYGEGSKLVGALLYHQLKAGAIELPMRLIVRRSLPCSSECLAELTPHYGVGHVVEGAR